MTTTTLAAPTRVNTTGVHARPGHGRLVAVELRKMVNTRAGATLVMSVGVVAAGVLVASPGVDGTWADAAPLIGQSAVYLTAGMITGVALGAILLASAPAIVALFALPIAWMAVVSLSFFADVAPWLSTARALSPM